MTLPPDITRLQSEMSATVAAHWKAFLFEGILLVVLGLAFVLTSIHHWFVNPDRNPALVLVPLGLISILIGAALLAATTAIYILGRNRIRTPSDGFSSLSGQG